MNHVDSDIKALVKTKDCRRKTLMTHFNADSEYTELPHLCCDNCASNCKCGTPDCGTRVKYTTVDSQDNNQGSGQERSVMAQDKKLVEEALIQYHKALVMKLLSTTANGEIKILTNLQFMLGFSEHQISQVLKNVGGIFTLSDVFKAVEVWDRRHAQKILSVINVVFDGVTSDTDLNAASPEDNYTFDDELLDEWNNVLQDDELSDMIIDNMSLSQLDGSILEGKQNDSSESMDEEMPSDVLAAIEDI